MEGVRDGFRVPSFENVLWRENEALLLEEILGHVWIKLDCSVDGVHCVELLRCWPPSSRYFGREILRNRTGF